MAWAVWRSLAICWTGSSALCMARPNLHVVAGAADGDGEFEALAVLAEERIEGSEQGGLPAGDHLRGHGVGADVAEELVGAAVNQVGSMELRGASGNLVVQRRDEQQRVAKREVNGHLGGNFGLEVAARGLGVAGFALGAHAEASRCGPAVGRW